MISLTTIQLTLFRSELLNASVANTAAVVYYLFDLVETSRLEAKVNFALTHLRRCALLAVGRMHRDSGGVCHISATRKIEFQGSGTTNLSGFMVNDGTHRGLLVAFHQLWNKMKTEGQLSSEFEAASFIDLVVFMSKCLKVKRSCSGHSFSKHGLTLRRQIKDALVKYMAASLDAVVIQAHVNGDLEDRQIPSRSRKKRRPSSDGQLVVMDGETQRKSRVQVDVNTIFEMHEHANEIGLSLPVYLKTKEKERQGGCHDQTCQMWLRKIHNMYTARSCLSFSTAKYVNIVSDASRFSGLDTLISVAYNSEDNVAVYLNNQRLRSWKNVAPGDLLLDGAVEVLAAERKLQRTSAYGLLQALSNQVKHLTKGRMTICNFDYADTAIGFAVKPLDPDHLRITSRDQNDQVHIWVQDKITGDVTEIDLTGAEDARVLTLGMDQGTSGMALASFLCGTNRHSSHLVSFSWDMYHRCHRDMKLSMKMMTIASRDARTVAKNNLQRAQLASTYLWSINSKPFGSSAFFQSKMELVEHFLALQDEE